MCNWRGRGIKNLLFAPQSVVKFSLSGLFKATTDLYGNCTLRHSGTSAAAPEAAGVFALALEAKYVPPCSCNEPYYLYQCKHNRVRIRGTHQLSSCRWTMDALNCVLYSELQFQAFAAYQCHWLPLSICILISFIIFSHSVLKGWISYHSFSRIAHLLQPQEEQEMNVVKNKFSGIYIGSIKSYHFLGAPIRG